MADKEEQAKSFLSALITESNIDRNDLTITGKSVEQIIHDSQLLSSRVRCVCGIHSGGDDLIQCPVCSMFLHRSCINLPPDFDTTNYICPFCLFQHYSIDPLSSLSSLFESFNNQIQAVYGIFKKLELLEKQTKQLYEALSKPGLTQSQRISFDEKYRQTLSKISALNVEWKERIQIVKSLQNVLHTVPPNAVPVNQ